MPSTVRQQQPRSFRAWLKLGLMFSIIASSILTLALGGFVRPQTIQVVSASNYVSSLYGEFSFRTTFGYDEDFSGWSIGHKSASATASIEASPNLLSVDGSFLNYSKPASVAVSKRTSVNITSAPILSTRVNVTGSVLYGLRFFGQYSNGTEFDVWWESSFLDHRPAMGYETIRLNMERQAFLATGRTVQVLTRFELYVEARPNTVADFRLELFELSFLNEETGPLGNQEGYKAVYIELDPKPSGPAAWYLNKFQLGARIVAIPCTTFTLHLIDGAALYTSIDSPSRYAYSPLTPSYNFAFYPEVSSKTFSELLPRSEFSIVLVANAGYFTDLTLNYLDFFFFPSPDSVVDLERSTLGLYYSYFVFFLFLLPVGLSVLVYREFFTRQSAGRRAVALVVPSHPSQPTYLT